LDIFIHAEKGLWDLVYVKIHTPFFGLLKLFPQKLPRKTGVFLEGRRLTNLIKTIMILNLNI